MPTGRLNMRRIRDVLRLKFGQGLSERQVAASLGLGKSGVGGYVRRAQQAGPVWPLPDGMEDDGLELLLFPALPPLPDPDRPVPDWAKMDQELRRPGVTRMLLWEEYRAAHPDGFAYTWFCTHFEAWKGRVVEVNFSRPPSGARSRTRCIFTGTAPIPVCTSRSGR